MSFFGFDTTLPRDRHSQAPAQQQQDASGRGGEDIEVYTWGEATYDGLGDTLVEDGDDFNDDTFGVPTASLASDFDFSNTPGFTSAGQPLAPRAPQSAQVPAKKSNNANAFASSLEDLWAMPSFGGSSASASKKQGTPGPATPTAPTAAPTAPRSLAEIEAELLAGRSSSGAPPPPPPTAPPAGGDRPPLTLAQVEAEMLAQRGTATPPQVPAQPQALAALMGQAQAQAPAPATPPTSVLSLLPQAPPQPLPPSISATLNTVVNTGGQTVTAQQRAAAHIASMHALLNALPPHVRGAVLALPPNLHFEALQDVVRQFPTLLASSKPSADGEPAPPADEGSILVQQDAVRYMLERAAKRVEEQQREEAKRRIRLGKIHSMSSHNNIMTNSDKDFITRIQVSQLVTNDPYSDDFYAHIYFAIRGNPNKPAAVAGTGATAASGKENKKRGAKARQLTRRENAMLRMQQQVQRLVENRKERMEKIASASAAVTTTKDGTSTPTLKPATTAAASTSSDAASAAASQTATLAGVLGKISLGTANHPKQMLAIRPESTSTTAAGLANDAVRQALAGASLVTTSDQGSVGPDGKRAPLTRYQVLSILEKLYDLVMSLEQRRRDVPQASSETEDEETKKWNEEQEALTSTLWKELRVLEPLDISDPHPFVSLLSSVKGKKFLPRALRHLSAEQTLTVLTMIVASFQTLDVVKEANALDDNVMLLAQQQQHQRGPATFTASETQILRAQRDHLERQTESFSNFIVPSMLSLMANAPLKVVSGMIALFVERNDVVRVARTRPGVAFLTIFLSRAESLKQSGNNHNNNNAAAVGAGAGAETAETASSPEDLQQWNEIFNLLFHRISAPGILPSLFPSARLAAADSTPFAASTTGVQQATVGDEADEPVWNLTAALAVSSSMEQQQVLVQELREKILENIFKAREVARRRREQFHPAQGVVGNEPEVDASDVRIRNVNLLLHALNLDATQITI
ncbi:DNA topoisomerase 2-associated protein pat1 [Tilletia horrida]|nr:DNA topoisomerase 2-associated protein pat1 [Tilletia horrida]